jgi:L-Lysine epsilon oxidase N-terminal/L-lysine epsilon oxidase C-terminal domain
MAAEIMRAEIHPGIGIARIGNSDEWFLAPEVMRPPPRDPARCRDEHGAIRREAVRFRIYGYDAHGDVVKELTAADAEIEWTVHMAAAKAQWYVFIAAMDRDQMKDRKLRRRNPDYDPAKRSDLKIDPGPVTIGGRNGTGQSRGRFTYQNASAEVLLGDLATDNAGRLVVVAGKGLSGSPVGLPPVSTDDDDWFGNSSGWFDDIADGPVTATVRVDGRKIHCSNAWVASAPPNFAPDILGWRTLDDLMQEVFIDAGWPDEPARPSFTRDIYPLFERLSGLQWVNQGIANIFGAGSLTDFTHSAFIDKISLIHNGVDDTYKPLRRSVANLFRPKDSTSWQALPPIYGDTFGTIGGLQADQPGNLLNLWDRAKRCVDKWVAGEFDADWNGLPSVQVFDDLPLAEQPRMLDRAAMHFCLADAFHPGCELTWPLRHATLYEAPYRIRMRGAGGPDPDYGAQLTQEIILSADGPLHAQGPGDLTRWMALPWQMDTLGCRSGYFKSLDPPTFLRSGRHAYPTTCFRAKTTRSLWIRRNRRRKESLPSRPARAGTRRSGPTWHLPMLFSA